MEYPQQVVAVKPLVPGQPLVRISIGDLVQRVAVGIHSEMDQLRHSFKRIDAELRTVTMRSFVSRTLKKLAQLYAVIRWIEQPGPQAYIESLAALHTQISLMDAQLAEIQDRLFWSHSFMFCMRSRKLEVSAAVDILTSETYPHLPAAIWTCGQELQAGKDFAKYSPADKAALVEELNVFVRAKLALGDPLPASVSFASVQQGYLRIRQADLWEVTLSLYFLSQRAGWVVLSANLLVGHHTDEAFVAGFNHEGVERDLLYILRAHAGAARDSAAEALSETAAAAAAETATSASAVVVKKESAASDVPRGGSAKTGSSSSRSRSSSSLAVAAQHKAKKRVFTLEHVSAVCNHLALSAALRLFYVQGTDLSRGIWKGRLEAEFLDDMGASQCSFRFWRCAFTGNYQFQARIVQPRRVGEGEKVLPFGGLGRPLLAQLHALVLSTVESAAGSLQPVPHFAAVPELIILQYITGGGVTFRRYFDAVLYALAKCKLVLLKARLLLDAAVTAAISAKLLELGADDVGVTMRLGSAHIRFCIDAQSGNYIVQDQTAGATSPALASGTARFLAEVNNLETQRCLRDMLGERGVQAFIQEISTNSMEVKDRVLALATAGQLLQYMALSSPETALTAAADTTMSPGGAMLLPALLAKANLPIDRAYVVLHVREYASLQLLENLRPVLKLEVPPEAASSANGANAGTSADATRVSAVPVVPVVPAATHATDVRAEAAYRAGIADMGLFVALSTDAQLNTHAHILLSNLKDADGGSSGEGAQAPRKKQKVNKNLTAGQLFALRAKEAEEDAQHAAQMEERRRRVVPPHGARLTFSLLQGHAVPRTICTAKCDEKAQNAEIAALLAAIEDMDQRWVRRPMPVDSVALKANPSLSYPAGREPMLTCHCEPDPAHRWYSLKYTFSQSAQPVFIARVAFLPPSTVQQTPQLIFLGSKVECAAPAPLFSALAYEVIHAAIHSQGADNAAWSPDKELQKVLELTMSQLNLLWKCLERLSMLEPPVPRPLTLLPAAEVTAPHTAEGKKGGATRPSKSAPANLQSLLVPMYLLKPLGLALDISGAAECAVQYSAHLRVYLDDGLGSVSLFRDECAGIVNISTGVGTSGVLHALCPAEGVMCSLALGNPVDSPAAVDAIAEKLVRHLGLHDFA